MTRYAFMIEEIGGEKIRKVRKQVSQPFVAGNQECCLCLRVTNRPDEIAFFENVHNGLCYGTDGLGWGQGMIMLLELANMVDNPKSLILLSCLLISSLSSSLLLIQISFSWFLIFSHLRSSLLVYSCVFSSLLVAILFLSCVVFCHYSSSLLILISLSCLLISSY